MSDFWAQRRVFVTGATGMVGSWLTRRLLNLGAHVVALIRDVEPRSELYRSGDINGVTVVNGRLEEFWTLERAVSEHEIDTVFHLGAQTIVPTARRSPLLTFESNIRGTYHLLEVCRLHRNLVQRIVVASTDKVYGEQDQPCREEAGLSASHPYETSKYCLELLAQAYVRTYGLPLVLMRCGNIYGGGDLNWSRLVPGTIRSLLREERPLIRSDGKSIRDFLYIDDAVDAYLMAAEQSARPDVTGQAFNVSAESPRSVLDVVALIQRLMGCELLEPVVLNEAPGELATQVLSADKAKRVLGWHSRWSLDDGLSAAIEWYRTFFTTGVLG